MLLDWYFDGDTPSQVFDGFKLSEPNARFFDAIAARVGAAVAGRTTYQHSGHWGGGGPHPAARLFVVVTGSTAEPARRRRQDNGVVIDKAELSSMSRAERQELAVLLAELDEPASGGDGRPAASAKAADPGEATPGEPDPDRADPFEYDPLLRRERRVALLIAAGCCVVLAGWIVVLAATLPHHFDAHHWRAVWVNFDVFLLAAFAATAWAIWRERQILILLLVLLGTMLFCDAWFDVGTSLATSGFWISLLSAVFAELPLAVVAFAGARRLLRATVAAGILAGERVRPGQKVPAAAVTGTEDWGPAGTRGRVGAGHSLRRTPLAGHGLDELLPRRLAERRAERAN